MVARALGALAVVTVLGATSAACRVLVSIDDRGGCAASCTSATERLACRGTDPPVVERCPADAQKCVGDGRCAACAEGDACGADGLGVCNAGGVCLGRSAKIASARRTTCLRAHDGAIYCWGANEYGESGTGNNEPTWLPVRVRGIPPVTDIAMGYGHVCALSEAKEVWCWGMNAGAQIGNGTGLLSTDAFPPSRVVGIENARVVAAGQAHNCVLLESGEVSCWGHNEYKQCGPLAGDARAVAVPVAHPGVTNVVSLVATKDFTCAIRNGSPSLVCWGDNEFGQLGPALPLDRKASADPIPIEIPDAGGAIAVATSYENACALFARRGEVYCWGQNRRGEFANGATSFDPDPNPARAMFKTAFSEEPLTEVEAIYPTDGSYRCVRMRAEVVSKYGWPFLCWGGNDRGEVGLRELPTRGENILHPAPARAIPRDTISFAPGDDHACFVAGSSGSVPRVECYGNEAYLGASATPDPAGAHPVPLPVLFPLR